MKKTTISIILLLFFISFLNGQSDLNRFKKESAEQIHFPFGKKLHDLRPSNLKVSITGQLLENPGEYRSSIEGKQRLDSIVSKDPATEQPTYKSAFMYDANGNNTLWTMAMWVSGWETTFEDHYTYDGNNNMTSEWSQFWDGYWIKEQKFEYTYDGEGKVTQHRSYYWSEENSDWEEAEKTDYTYGEDGMLQETLSYYLEEGEWVLAFKTEYSYDNDGNVTEILVSVSFSDMWLEYQKTEYTYENGNLTEEVYYELDFDELILLPFYKDNHAYDQNGNRTQTIYAEWFDAWVNVTKEEYSIDASNNIAENITYEWVESAWQKDTKVEFTYNNDYGFDDLILPIFYLSEFPELFNHMNYGGPYYLWNNETNEWELDDISTLHYSEQTVSDIAITNSLQGTKVYPNPASTHINIDLVDMAGEATVELFDLQGRKVIGKVVSGKTQIDLNHLESGMYIYKIENGGNIQSGKLMVK